MAKRKKRAPLLVNWDWEAPQVSKVGNKVYTSDCGKFQVQEFARYGEIPMERVQWTVWKLKASPLGAYFCWIGDKASRKGAILLCESRRKSDDNIEWENEQ